MVTWVVLAALVVALAVRFSVPGSTDHDVLRAGPFRRAWRSARATVHRALASIAGWPHVIDLALGTHRASVEGRAREVVWRSGRASLFRYIGARSSDPVLVVHAPVTKPWILDLPGRSLIGALLERGQDVFLLDWGDIDFHDAHRGLDAHVGVLLAAEREVRAATGRERLHLAGLCLGATLCIARLAAFAHPSIASVVAIAPPVDFAVPGGMGRWMASRALHPGGVLDGGAMVPAAVVRESFHAVRPRALHAVARGIRARRDPIARAVYGVLARWVWEQRPVAGAMFCDIVRLYRTNALLESTLEVCGRRADIRSIRAPIFLAVAGDDHIVPPASSLALADIAELDVTTLISAGGHVSMLTGHGRFLRDVGDWLEPETRATGGVGD